MNEFISNFKRQKTTGLFSIISLGLGTMVAIMIGMWSISELNFDNFHRDGDRIYRITGQAFINNTLTKISKDESCVASDEKVLAGIPEVEQLTYFTAKNGGTDAEANHAVFSIEPSLVAKENFFSFFSFPLKEGNPETALNVYGKVVIDETMAALMFPGKKALGETLKIGGSDMEVAGVMYDIPRNSHIQARMIIAEDKHNRNISNDNWEITYYRLAEGADCMALEQKLTRAAHEQEKYPYLKEMDYQIRLQPLKNIHFDGDYYLFDNAVKGSKTAVGIYITVAVVILLLSCINFTNLFVSTAFLRAKSVCVRQVMGASRNGLRLRFYVETACYAIVSLAVGLFLAVVLTPYFNQYANSNLYIDFRSVNLYAFLFSLFVFVVIAAGSMPAFGITRMNLLEALKGNYRGRPVSFSQKGLTILQFTASIALLLITLLINHQVKFMQSRNIGFNKDNIIYAFANIRWSENTYETIHHELIKEPAVADITLKAGLPSEWSGGTSVTKPGDERSHSFETVYARPNYFDVMGMQIIEGENPFGKYEGDNYCVLNETAVRLLGLENPIDQTILLMTDQPCIVKGVIRDAQVRSFHKATDPQIYLTEKYWEYMPVLIKISGEPQKAIAAIEKRWKTVLPDVPFDYHFLDEEYEKMYASENNLRNILAAAMAVGFVISVAGLFAMAFYSVQRRRKEIAIRKIVGASVKDLLQLLNKDFILWVMIAFVTGSLIAWFFMEKYWLKSFIAQAPLSIGIFAGVGLAACLITLLTVSWQTWTTATANPVKAIKSE